MPSRAIAGGMRTRIRVVVRVRPPIAEDVDQQDAEQYAECVEEDAVRGTLQLKKPFFDTREFSLDTVLARDATQAQTYDVVGRPVVDDVLEGFNGTVLAYGQTGTGKTFTVYGPLSYWRRAPIGKGVGGGLGHVAPTQAAPQLVLQPQLELSGIVTRAAMQIFAHADELRQRGDGTQVRVLISSLQIWQEAISDLLGERRSSGPLTVREDPERGVYAEGLSEHEVLGADGVLALVHESATNRATCSTSMNRSSSRSHALLLIRVEQWTPPPDEAAASTGDAPDDRSSVTSSHRIAVKRSLLSIVDLAGSERVCKSGSDGIRLEEAKRINKSISALGNCIAALASGHGHGKTASHIPYRDSKLTRLLTDSLGGNTKTTLCANVGPSLSNYDETFCTLLLATRAMAVKTHVKINEKMERNDSGDGDGGKLALLSRVRELQSEVMRLRKESAGGGGGSSARLRAPPRDSSLSAHSAGWGSQREPRTPDTWGHSRCGGTASDAPPTWAVGRGGGHASPYCNGGSPGSPGGPPGGGTVSSSSSSGWGYTGLAGLAGLHPTASLGNEDPRAASAACTAALQASARMHVAPPATSAAAGGAGAAQACAAAQLAQMAQAGAYGAVDGGVAEWGQVVWSLDAMDLSDATRRLLPGGGGGGSGGGGAAATGEPDPSPYIASASEWPPDADWPTRTASQTNQQAQQRMLPPPSAAGVSAALQARLAQGRGRPASAPQSAAAAPPPSTAPPTGPEPSCSSAPPRGGGAGGVALPGAAMVEADPPPGAGSRAAALAAHITAAGLSLEPTPHPSPSALPRPSSSLMASQGAALMVPPGNEELRVMQHAQHALQVGEMGGEGGGDVVLDQLVSGLLATPCIRKRLDRLYGKAAQPHRAISQPSSRAGSVAGSGPSSPGAWQTPRDYLGPGLPPPPQSPAGGRY